jgi:Sec7-like guanine-nucleotide exchange factor
MHMSLPRETQQIDRIIEAFAVRYEECEPGLFSRKGEYGYRRLGVRLYRRLRR